MIEDVKVGGSTPKGVQILVVEDLAPLRKLFDRVLSLGGFEVLSAGSRAEAVALWEANTQSVALVITDVMVPGMLVAEFVALVRNSRPNMPIVCTSGHDREDLEARGILPPDVVFAEKPIAIAALLKLVQDLAVPVSE